MKFEKNNDIKKKIVMIAVHHGFSVRYLLQTDILKRISDKAEKVIIVVSEEGSYLDQFDKWGNIEIEIISKSILEQYYQSSYLQKFLRTLRLHTYGKRTTTSRILWKFYYYDQTNRAKKTGLFKKIIIRAKLVVQATFIFLLNRIKPLRKILVWIEKIIFCPNFYDEILKKYNPDSVVVSSLGTFDFDQYIMRAAKRRQIPVISVVLSWDNTTTRGYPGAFANKVITWTEKMKSELCDLHDHKPDKIFVGGVAHFKKYYENGHFKRNEFLTKIGADPNKKILFIATRTPNSYPWNTNIVEIVAQAIKNKQLMNCQVIVRIHPLHYKMDDKGFFVYQKVLDIYEKIKALYEGDVILNKPSLNSNKLDYAMHETEITVLTGLIKSSDVIITIFSTINIEGAILDKPLVNVCFENLPMHYHNKTKARFNIIADSEMTHNKRIIDTNGISVAYTQDELIKQTRRYLENPNLDKEGRNRIVANEAGPNKEKAGIVIANEILTV